MEVYQSTRTAAELDYALSAVPSIGANGNWFIGEQDTGIFAAGVNVSGAEAGQTIVASEVDSNGRPTGWLPVNFPVQLPFCGCKTRLIVNLAVAKDENDAYPAYIDITQRDDGTPLNLRAFVVQTDITTGISYMGIDFNGRLWTSMNYIIPGKDHTSAYFIDKSGGILSILSGTVNGRWGYYPVGARTVQNGGIGGLTDGIVNKITLPGRVSSLTGGTFIKIWEIYVEE
jgi:hypothetical protein